MIDSTVNLNTETGLSTQAAIAQLNQDGHNELPSAQSRSLLAIAWGTRSRSDLSLAAGWWGDLLVFGRPPGSDDIAGFCLFLDGD